MTCTASGSAGLPDGTYTKDAHRMMGEMYVGDERFRAYYEAIAPGCAAFFRDGAEPLLCIKIAGRENPNPR